MNIRKGLSDVEDMKYRLGEQRRIVELLPFTEELKNLCYGSKLPDGCYRAILDDIINISADKSYNAFFSVGHTIGKTCSEKAVIRINGLYFDPYQDENCVNKEFIPLYEVTPEDLFNFYIENHRLPVISDLRDSDISIKKDLCDGCQKC